MNKLGIFAVIFSVAALSHADGLMGFDARLTADLDIVQSTRNQTTFRGILEGVRKSDMDSLRAKLRYSYAEQRIGSVKGVTTDNWFAGGLYERIVNEKFDWFLEGSWERDAVVSLDLRQVYTGGLSFKMKNTEDEKLKFRAGLGYVMENFRADPDTSGASLSFGTDWWKKLNEKSHFAHVTRLVPSVDDFSDYLFQSDFGYFYKLNEKMDASFRMLLDYDTTPAAGFRKDRLEWIFGISYKF